MFKCEICGAKINELTDMHQHIEDEHYDMIPKDFSASQYYYQMRTGKDHGSCIICHMNTKWNESTFKYARFCEMPQCKKTYVDEFKKRMIGKYGKVNLLNDPEQQKKMLANRSISGKYKWSDGSDQKTYTGSYELDALKLLDLLMFFDSADVMTPSPHTYYYEYEGEKKFYIPDIFIASLNLEIEIKDGGDNPNMHHKIQDVDKVKEKLKDDVLMSQNSFSYIKITNKNYEPLFEFLYKAKKQYSENPSLEENKPIFVVNESVEVESENYNEIAMEGIMYSITNKMTNFSLNRPLNVAMGTTGAVSQLKKIANKAKTRKEIDHAIEVIDKNISNMKRNKNYKLNHGNLIPVVDKKVKEPFIDKFITELEQIKSNLIKRRSTVKEGSLFNLTDDLDEVDIPIPPIPKELLKKISPALVTRLGFLEAITSFKEVRKDMLEMVNNSKLEDDIKLLQNDKKIITTYIKDLSKKQPAMKKSCDEQLNWMDTEYQKAIDTKLAEIKKYNKQHPSMYEIKPSQIHGKGVFATTDIPADTFVGYAINKIDNFEKPDDDYKRTELGRYANHQINPNMKIIKREDGSYLYVTKDNVKKGTELTVNYKDFNLNGKQPITEGFLKSEDNFYYNFDQWESGEKNMLFIVGLSGSGKSTFGKQLAAKYKCEFYELDGIKERVISELGAEVYKGWNADPATYAFQLFNYIENKFKGKRIIVEGVKVLKMDWTKVKEYPVIIMGTSFMTSTLRALARDFEKEHWNRYHSIDPAHHIKTNVNVDNIVQNFKNYMDGKGEYIIESSATPVVEATAIAKGFYPVYILLTYTDTAMAKVIRFYTGDPYSHSSISFTSDMDDVYSFGRKFKDSPMTFINENIKQGIFKDVEHDAQYSLYVTFVTKEQFDLMQKKLNEFKKRSGNLRYSFHGLFNIALGKETHIENEYFCSQFVVEILRAGDPNSYKKDSSLYSPYDLTKVNNVYFVTRGKLANYDRAEVDRKVSVLIDKI